jgi:hypothetical protein
VYLFDVSAPNLCKWGDMADPGTNISLALQRETFRPIVAGLEDHRRRGVSSGSLGYDGKVRIENKGSTEQERRVNIIKGFNHCIW